MQYAYAAMWFVIGLILIFALAKENKVFYFAGGFFLLLGGWWLADALTEVNLFAGGWGIGFRVVCLAALAAFGIVFFRERRKMLQSSEKSQDGQPADEKAKK